ncbi:hypothetical protein ACS49_03265 [Bacillus cereus]|nr:hypothetical protein ACS49_03265 [Bacillus cereus]
MEPVVVLPLRKSCRVISAAQAAGQKRPQAQGHCPELCRRPPWRSGVPFRAGRWRQMGPGIRCLAAHAVRLPYSGGHAGQNA